MTSIKLLLGLFLAAGLAACDAPVEQKSGAAKPQDSKDGAKSSGAKSDTQEAPMVIRSPDNPYQ
jgi:uncharacterized lipoprotein